MTVASKKASPARAPLAAPLGASVDRQRIEAILERDGPGYEFIQVLRLLQRMYPDRESVGGWSDPQKEVARLHVIPSFAFPASEVSDVDFGTRDEHGESRQRAHW